jgi:LPXTG-motif cell wall-anchored protein
MKRGRKFLCLLLAVCLTLSLAPLSALAVGESASVGNVTISGTVGTALSAQSATITLSNETVTAAGLSGIDASSWFTALPAGVTATADAVGGTTSITITFGGTPTAVSSAELAITIPISALTTSVAPLAVTANADAKFDITEPVKTIGVTTQITPLRSGVAGSTTYAVTMANIANGTYPVTLSGAPAGVTADDLTVSSNSATLRLNTTAATPNGSYALTVTIDSTTSNQFTLAVLGPIPILDYGAITIDGTETLTGTFRLFRDGNPSAFASPKSFPGTYYQSPTYFRTVTITSPASLITISYMATNDKMLFAAAYKNSFDPNNMSENYLGDSGSSATLSNGFQTFEVTVPQGDSLVLVFMNSDQVPGSCLYAVQGTAPVSITSLNYTTVTSSAGGTFQVTPSGTGPISYSLTGAPDGVGIDSATGLMSIAPGLALGSYTFTVPASNSLGSATQTFTLGISAGAISGLPASYTLSTGETVTFTPSPLGGAWSYDNAFLTRTLDGSGNGVFTAIKAGTTTVTYTVGGVAFTVTLVIKDSDADGDIPLVPLTGDPRTPLPYVMLGLLALGGAGLLIGKRRKSQSK